MENEAFEERLHAQLGNVLYHTNETEECVKKALLLTSKTIHWLGGICCRRDKIVKLFEDLDGGCNLRLVEYIAKEGNVSEYFQFLEIIHDYLSKIVEHAGKASEILDATSIDIFNNFQRAEGGATV